MDEACGLRRREEPFVPAELHHGTAEVASWNRTKVFMEISHQDTLGMEESVLISEVSCFKHTCTCVLYKQGIYIYNKSTWQGLCYCV